MPTRRRNRTPTSSSTVAANLRGLADDCAAFVDEIVDEALPAIGADMKRHALEAAARVTGGDRRLSRMNRGRGVRLDAGYDKVGPATVRLTPRPLGPWTLVESGSARSTWYEPRAGKSAPRRRRRRRLRLANGAVRWYVRHGPVRGKQAWTRARRNIEDNLPEVVAEAVPAAWSRVRS